MSVKTMSVHRSKSLPPGINLSKEISSNTFLGTLISSDGGKNFEIASRIAQAKKFLEDEIDTIK